MSFEWLHGDNGVPCAKCGYRMDGLAKVWNVETKAYVPPPEGKCSSCRDEEARNRWAHASGESISQSLQSWSPLAQT